MVHPQQSEQGNTPRPRAYEAGSAVGGPKNLARGLAVLAILGAVVWAIYGRALHAPFIFDDGDSVQENPSIVRLWPLVGEPGNPGPLQPGQDSCVAGRPLVNLSLALNYAVGGLSPTGYHAVNLVLHVLSAFLLWGIVRRTLRLPYFEDRFARAADPLALAVALVWAVHPLQIETVEYVTQRTELLMGFCYLATLYASLRYWAASAPRGRTVWCLLAGCACAGGMASKEVMVSAPVVVLLFERTFLAGSLRSAVRQSWPLYLALAAGWGVLLFLNVGGPRARTAGFHLEVPAYVWWSTQCQVLFMYLRLFFWPWPLVIHYEIPLVDTLAAAWPWLLSAAVLGVVTLLLFWRRTAAGFLAVCVWAILSPTLVVPIITEVAAERRMYLPVAALAALVIVGGYAAAQRATQALTSHSGAGAGRGLIAALELVVLAVVSLFGWLDVRRLTVYADELTLWQDTLATQPDNSLAHTNLGFVLASRGQTKEGIAHYREALRLHPEAVRAHLNLGNELQIAGLSQEAIEHYREALRLHPDYAEAHYNLGAELFKIGQRQEAIEQYREALRLKPSFSQAHMNLGVALVSAGQFADAIDHYHAALRLKPDFAEARINLGLALSNSGRQPEAIEQLEQALLLQPENGTAHTTLGLLLTSVGKNAEAMPHFSQAIERSPENAQALYGMAVALNASGDQAGAEDYFDRALAQEPDYAEAHYGLALLWLAKNDPTEALAHLEEALRINPRFADAHYVLAGMLAGRGDLQGAARHYTTVLELRPQNPRAWNNLGVVLMNLNETARAIPHFQEAVRQDPGYREAQANLAAALERQRQEQQDARPAMP